MKERRRRRLNYSIKRRMQFRLFFGMMAVVLIAVGLTSVFFYFFSNQEVGSTYKQFHVNVRSFLELLLPGVVIAFLLGLAAATALVVFMPHRIAGPLYRIENDLKNKVGEGDLTVKFTVRKGDEVGELADALNVTLEKIRGKVLAVKGAAEELSMATKDAHGGIKDSVKKIEDSLKEFKL